MQFATTETTTERTADPLWDVLSGTYVGLLATPIAILAVSRLGVVSPALLYGTTVALLAGVLGLGWWVSARRDGMAVRLGATRLRWLPAAVPVAYALLGFASIGTTGVVGVVGFFFGLAAMAIGVALGVMARTRHTDAVLAGVEPTSTFRAGWPAGARRRLGVAAVGSMVVAGLCFAAGLLGDRFVLQAVGQVLFPVGAVLYTTTEKRRFAVTSAGIEQRLPVARRLVRWDAFDGYTRTDDALVLHRPWGVDARFALADLDDPDAVEAAIADHLPA